MNILKNKNCKSQNSMRRHRNELTDLLNENNMKQKSLDCKKKKKNLEKN